MFDYLIDSHCHLHDQEFFTPEQAEEFLQLAKDANVRQIICIGTDPQDSLQAGRFALAHANVFWTYGVHPEHAGKADVDLLAIKTTLSQEFAEFTSEDMAEFPSQRPENVSYFTANCKQKLVAIGEIGLDYHYEGYSREAQIRLFEQMLQLARNLKLPVSLHIREAFTDAWPVLDNFSEIKGVVHSFTGSKKDLREALNRDFCIGVNGLATYTTPALPPLEKMVLETDAPFLTPVPFRGTIKLNQPAYVREIADYLAEKMGVATVNIAEQTTKNARQLFKLGEFIP